MVELGDLGLRRGIIYEAIVSTFSQPGARPNAAPMGVVWRGGRVLVLKHYTHTQTFRNLQATKCAVINLTNNPHLFYKATFKDDANPLPKNLFEKAVKVGAPRLRGVEAHLEVSVRSIAKPVAERVEVIAMLERVSVNRKTPPQPYSRAPFAVIESIIHATRIKERLASGRIEEAEGLVQKVEDYGRLVGRVAPATPLEAIMGELASRIEEWKRAAPKTPPT